MKLKINGLQTLICALFLMSVVGLSCGNFCDAGPPGKYCFEDLTGWYNCQQQGGKMVQTETNCPQGQRCTCFPGPPCPDSVQDPCGNPEPPPQFPPAFTMYYNEKQVECSPTGCVTTYNSGEVFQNYTARKLRHQRTGPVYEYWITLPNDDGTFATYAIREDLSTCTRTNVPEFPRFGVPFYFANKGSVTINSTEYEHWLWRTGGHNIGEATTEENWYIKKNSKGDFEPGLYDYLFPGTQVSKISLTVNKEFPDFSESVDDTKFKLPSFCEKINF